MTESLPPYARLGEVDSIDGFVMALSPWAMRNLRFDESLGQIHGYDFDICMQARAAGKKVVTADLQVVHHHSLRLIDNPETWINAYMRVAEKWDEQIPHNGSRDRDWEWRARRAEAEASAARLMGGRRGAAAGRPLEAARGDRRTASRWRITRAAAPALGAGCAGAQRPRRATSSAAADLLPRERRPAAPCSAREPLGERRSAREPASARSTSSRGRARARRSLEPPGHPVALDHVADPVRLEPLEHRVAVPGRDRRGDRRRPGRVAVPDDAEAEERRHPRELELRRGRRGSPRPRSGSRSRARPRARRRRRTASPRARCPAPRGPGRCRGRAAGGARPGSAPARSRRRGGQRPADVVEHQQRHRRRRASARRSAAAPR